jgi:hypothetical protein
MIFGPVSQLTLSETGPANDPIQSLLGTSSQIYSASLHLLFLPRLECWLARAGEMHLQFNVFGSLGLRRRCNLIGQGGFKLGMSGWACGRSRME